MAASGAELVIGMQGSMRSIWILEMRRKTICRMGTKALLVSISAGRRDRACESHPSAIAGIRMVMWNWIQTCTTACTWACELVLERQSRREDALSFVRNKRDGQTL